MKNITILGSTGSIGLNALKVILSNPDKYRAVALGAGRNIRLLLEQMEVVKPDAVSVLEENDASYLKKQLSEKNTPEIYFGAEGFIRVSTLDNVDTVISAVTGAAGLLPTFEAIKAGKNIALANKETMVMAGPLVMAEAKRRDVTIMPVDSEHSAILQSLQGHPRNDVKRVILTASGGPFRDYKLEDLEKVTTEQALNHPNWEMGAKISIDSATMMNKGLEAIEAKWFFDLDIDQVHILIHPQSIVHSLVEYKDKSVVAQLGIPDMIIPISYALSYPDHYENGLESLELDQVGTLTFEKPDYKKFRCLTLALDAARTGKSMPAVLNGANEIAVNSFLNGKIIFTDIPVIIEETMAQHNPFPIDSIESVMEADQWARQTAKNIIIKASGSNTF
jgi:1-deoxy-D-xylulose-5-phosphate reductoisomerase